MNLLEMNSMEERLEALSKTVKPFKDRAKEHDENISFPFENFKELKEIGYPALTLPKKYGGLGISLYEMLRYQEVISKADGSTGLAVGWHMGIMKSLGEDQTWEEEKFAAVAKDVVETGALLNNAATEPATGSPTRGGRPETHATKTDTGWVINGRKTFTTLSPILSYFVVSASIDGTEDVGNFLIKREREGVAVEETWDSIAMRGTGSHDLILKDVPIDEDDLVQKMTKSARKPAGWLLHIPACYIGIAQAAQEAAIDFATSYSPNSIEGTISELPNVKQRLGEIELRILESRHFLFSVAKKWDESDEDTRQKMGPELGAVKTSVVNNALEAVDEAMRVVGARSLSAQSDLQRHYRDVRAGIHNPPMDDMIIMQLAGKSIEER